MNDKKRLQFDFEGRLVQSLDDMKEKTEVGSRAEVVRDALKVADWFSNVDPEHTVIITDKSGEVIFQGPAKLLQG